MELSDSGDEIVQGGCFIHRLLRNARRGGFLLLLPLLLSAFSVGAWAQQVFKKVGSAGYAFLSIPVSARTAALGETSMALDGLGAEAIFSNPSAIGFAQSGHMFMVSYSPWIAETKHQAVAYVFQRSDVGFFGVSVIHLDIGEMQGTVNPDPTRTGSYIITEPFTADGIAIGFTYGRRLTDRFSFGVTGKFIQERISVYKSQNFGFDAGILYYTGFRSLRVAGGVRNFGVDAKYLEGVFKMPTDFRFGLAMEVYESSDRDHIVTLAGEALHPSDNDERINVGAEYGIARLVTLRGGYKFNYDEETWSAGLGLRVSSLNLDLSYSDLGRLGGNVRVTLAFAME